MLFSLATRHSPLATLFAVADFPRGHGFYLNVPAFLAVVVVYLAWVRTCWWVDRDARQLKLPVPLWNAVLLGCGLLGLVVVWLFPPWMFLLSFSVLLLLYLGSSLVYVRVRNEGVEPERAGADAAAPARPEPPLAPAQVQGARTMRKRRRNPHPLYRQERRRPGGGPQPRAAGPGVARLPGGPQDGLRSPRNARHRHPPGADQGGDDRPLPHRRHPPDVRPVQPADGRFGPEHLQGAGRPRHHREAQAAGRQLLRRGPRAGSKKKKKDGEEAARTSRTSRTCRSRGRSTSAWRRPAAWSARRWSCASSTAPARWPT